MNILLSLSLLSAVVGETPLPSSQEATESVSAPSLVNQPKSTAQDTTASAANARQPWPYEVISGGTPETTFLIARDVFEKGKLPQPVVVSDDLRVTHAFVGYWEQEAKTGRFFFQTDGAAPLAAGQLFGWILKVQTTRTSVDLTESFRLPERSQSWTVNHERTKISADGLTATSQHSQHVWDFLFNIWTMEDGDPEGRHEFSLSIDDVKIVDLPLEVKKSARR